MSLISKNFLSKKGYQKIVDLYNLGTVREIFGIKQGFEASKAVAETTKGRFIISLYKLVKEKEIIRKTKASLNWELELANFFKHLPVPHFLKSKNQRLIEDFQGFSVTVSHYLPGKNPKSISLKQVYKLGRFLAEFHKQGKKFKVQCSDRRKFYDLTLQVMNKMNPNVRKQKHPLLKKSAQAIIDGVRKYYPPAGLSQGPIHVDIKPENELFSGDKLTGVIDFGIAYIGPYMVDVGKCIMWNCLKNEKINRVLLQSFLKGYKSKRQLTKAELDYLNNSIVFGIYSLLYVDLYHLPNKRVTLNYCLELVRRFMPLVGYLKKSLN